MSDISAPRNPLSLPGRRRINSTEPTSETDAPRRGFGWSKSAGRSAPAQRVSSWADLSARKEPSASLGGTDGSRPAEATNPLASARDGTSNNTGGAGAPSRPADLRRPGPFATDDARTAAAARSAPSLSAAQATSYTASGAGQAPVLRLDDFEAPARNWQKKRLDPVAPRVHPNPTPVNIVARRALSEGAEQAIASGNKKAAKRARRELGAEARKAKGSGKATQNSDLWYLITLFVISAIVIGLLINWYNQNALQRDAPTNRTLSQSERVIEAEQALQALQFDPGSIDGVEDFQFRQALLRFQVFAGLPQNGKLSDEVLSELQAISQIMGSQ